MAFNHLHKSGFEDSKTRIERTVYFEEVGHGLFQEILKTTGVGAMKLFSNATRGVIIHEFGHVLGLDDEYSDVTRLGAGGMGPPHTFSVANLGYENNLMGNNSTRSEWDLSSQQLQRIRSKPIRNGFDYQ